MSVNCWSTSLRARIPNSVRSSSLFALRALNTCGCLHTYSAPLVSQSQFSWYLVISSSYSRRDCCSSASAKWPVWTICFSRQLPANRSSHCHRLGSNRGATKKGVLWLTRPVRAWPMIPGSARGSRWLGQIHPQLPWDASPPTVLRSTSVTRRPLSAR